MIIKESLVAPLLLLFYHETCLNPKTSTTIVPCPFGFKLFLIQYVLLLFFVFRDKPSWSEGWEKKKTFTNLTLVSASDDLPSHVQRSVSCQKRFSEFGLMAVASVTAKSTFFKKKEKTERDKKKGRKIIIKSTQDDDDKGEHDEGLH